MRLPIAVTDAESGKAVYRGPASDGRLWESLLEDAKALPAPPPAPPHVQLVPGEGRGASS